jgi:hypothetical protein
MNFDQGDQETAPARIAARLAGHGKCYVCGEQQSAIAPHLGCSSRHGLNRDVQALLREHADQLALLQQTIAAQGWRPAHRGELVRAVKDIRAASTLDDAVNVAALLLPPLSVPEAPK